MKKVITTAAVTFAIASAGLFASPAASADPSGSGCPPTTASPFCTSYSGSGTDPSFPGFNPRTGTYDNGSTTAFPPGYNSPTHLPPYGG